MPGQASELRSRGKSGGQLKNVPTTNTSKEVALSSRKEFDFMVKVAAAMIVFCAIAENVQPTAYGKFGDGKGLLQSLNFGVSPRLGWWLMEGKCGARESFAQNALHSLNLIY